MTAKSTLRNAVIAVETKKAKIPIQVQKHVLSVDVHYFVHNAKGTDGYYIPRGLAVLWFCRGLLEMKSGVSTVCMSKGDHMGVGTIFYMQDCCQLGFLCRPGNDFAQFLTLTSSGW